MLYPSLHININKKRGAGGLDDTSSTLINTPVILDMAVQMSDEKNNNFAFSHQPSLPFSSKHERLSDEKPISLQTPILDINQTPFFNHTSNAVSPSDGINSFVPPNEILNTYTTANSSTSTSTTSTYNDLNQSSHLASTLQLQTGLNQHHPLSISSKIISASKQQQQQQQQQQDNIHQNDYHQFTSAPYTSTAQQVSQYANLTDLNDNITHLSQLTNQQDQQSVHQQTLTYTELKPSINQSNQQLYIPNSVYDIAGSYKTKHHEQQLSYLSPSSPANSLSSQTSSSNLDNHDSVYGQFGESSTSHSSRSNRRYPGQTSSSQSEKKSRMTKKQKYDAMINEEKTLLKNNDQLKNDIKDLENKIVRYKQTIMNTVKNNK